MKMSNLSWLLPAAFLAVPAFAADSSAPAVPPPTPAPEVPAAAAPAPAALSPGASEVIKLSGASVGDEVVIAYIKNCQSPFRLTATAIVRLKDAKVSSQVITAMLTHDSVLASQSPASPADYNQRLYPPAEGTVAAPPPSPAPVPVPAQPAPPPQGVAPVEAPLTPPAAQVEVVPVAPGPDYYWAPGYWGWNGGWIWIGGGWRLRGGFGWGPHFGGWYGHGAWGGFHGGGGFRGGGHGGHGR